MTEDELVELSHPAIDWTVRVDPKYVRHYLDDGWRHVVRLPATTWLVCGPDD